MVELNPNISVITMYEILTLKDKDGQMKKMIKSSYLHETHLKYKDLEML